MTNIDPQKQLETRKDLETFFNYRDVESKIFVPNEIFADFKAIGNIKTVKGKSDEEYRKRSDGKKVKKGVGKSQVPFAFSYYYLISYLYRNAKYGEIQETLTQGKLKEILGFSSTYKDVNYIIKEGGMLDQMQYTETTDDIPILASREVVGVSEYVLTKEERNKYLFLDFEYYDWEEGRDPFYKHYTKTFPNSYKIKKPIRGFHKCYVDENNPDKSGIDETVHDGSFYEVDNTTLIPFEIFIFCMERKSLGCNAFFLYSYLKMMNDKYNDGYDCPLDKLQSELCFSRPSLNKYIKLLRKHNMIEVIYNQEFFSTALEHDERMANTYITNEWIYFNDNGNKKIEMIKTISAEDYHKMKEAEEKEKEERKKIEVELNKLPY